MFQQTLTLATCVIFAATAASADSKAFRSILGDAANIQRDSDALSADLKSKTLDETRIKADIDSLGQDIASLRKDVEALDANLSSLSDQQKKDWELVKTKSQLLTIMYDRKVEFLQGDLRKNRGIIRALAAGISERADMLQKTVNRLDR